MSVTPKSGSQITLAEAQALVNKFRSKFPNEIKASFVGKDNVNLILEQPDCIGIRIYNGYDQALGRFSPVLVGVNSVGKDMTNGVIVDRLMPCPSYCDTGSDLFFK